MGQEDKQKVLFPRYTTLLKKKERQEKLRKFGSQTLKLFLELLGILWVVFLGYLFLSSFFNYEPSDPEDGLEKTDYSPYSGWTYE
jgi:hypothetical protein